MRILICLAALALCVVPARAQTDLSTRVAELERLTAQHTKELQALRATADDHDKRLSILEAKMPGKPPGIVQAASGGVKGTPCPSCPCGCLDGAPCTCATAARATVRYWTYAGSGVVYGSDGSVSSADGFQTLTGQSCGVSGALYYSTAGASGGCASGSCGSSGRGLFGRRR
jgi:hypothetical protein